MKTGPLESAEVVAWACFVIGVVVLVVGLYLGLKVAPEKAKEKNKEKVDEVKKELAATTSNLEAVASGNLESDTAAAGAVANARSSAAAAKSAAEQIGGIIGSLPEFQRFPALLVLVGVLLMSVGTVQFGGTRLF